MRSEKGGWMRLEDFCNSTTTGTGYRYTSGMVSADEELLGCELGDRVADYILEYAIDYWDALADALYEEDIRTGRI